MSGWAMSFSMRPGPCLECMLLKRISFDNKSQQLDQDFITNMPKYIEEVTIVHETRTGKIYLHRG